MYQNPFTRLRRPMLEGADQNAVGTDIVTQDSRLAGSRRLPKGAAQAIMAQRRNRMPPSPIRSLPVVRPDGKPSYGLSSPVRQQPNAPGDLSKPIRFQANDNGMPTSPANDLVSVGDRMQPVNDMDSGYLRTGISDRARQVRNPILAARRQFNRMD